MQKSENYFCPVGVGTAVGVQVGQVIITTPATMMTAADSIRGSKASRANHQPNPTATTGFTNAYVETDAVETWMSK